MTPEQIAVLRERHEAFFQNSDHTPNLDEEVDFFVAEFEKIMKLDQSKSVRKILAFGRTEADIAEWAEKNKPRFGEETLIIIPIYKKADFLNMHIGKNEKVMCVHCGSWEKKSFDLYLEALEYYKTIPRDTIV